MFKPRQYDPNRADTRTKAQIDASERNFRIFKLRGLHAQCFMLTGKRREQAQAIVDMELKAPGAESQTDRINKWRLK